MSRDQLSNRSISSEPTGSTFQSDSKGTVGDKPTSPETATKKDLQKIQRDFERRASTVSVNVVETLGIFVALFTFVSLEFTIFRSTDKTMLIPLSLVILGGLLLFIVLFDRIFDRMHSRLDVETVVKKVKSSSDGFVDMLIKIAVLLLLIGGGLYGYVLIKNDPLDVCLSVARKASDAAAKNNEQVSNSQNGLYQTMGCTD